MRDAAWPDTRARRLPMAAPKPTDAIALLKADHQKVKNLFQRYEGATDQKTKQQIAEQG
jgi:hypothetical protein